MNSSWVPEGAVRECLLPLAFLLGIYKCQDYNIRNYNTACCFVWV
jgi:hypothetical protein